MSHFKKNKSIYKKFLQYYFPKLYWTRIYFGRNKKFKVFSHSIISISPKSTFEILEKGALSINTSWFKGKERRYRSEFRLDDYSTFICTGDFKLYQGASIYVAPQAKLLLGGKSFINTNSTLNCFHYIEIGNGCGISDNVCISDSDNHKIIGRKNTAPIIIKDHVWIGKNVTILKGVTIGAGSIVAAGSVVNRDVPENSLVAGVPAKVVKQNINWEW